MKTIKLIVRVSGYLNEVDNKDFELVEQQTEVSCVETLNEIAIQYLKDSFPEIVKDALHQWNMLNYDYKGVKDEG